MIDNTTVKIILIEDDTDLRESLIDCLGLHGFTVTGTANALCFYQEISTRDFDIAIIDIGLPDLSGLEIVSHIKEKNMGVVILSAIGNPETRIDGYERGADLYMVKPVKCRELAAALSNLIIRINGYVASSAISTLKDEETLSPWILNPIKLQLMAPCQKSITLSLRETKFLEVVMDQPGTQINRIDLQQVLNLSFTNNNDRRIDSMIRRLRQKVKNTSGIDLPIQTVYGEGYIFSALSKIN